MFCDSNSHQPLGLPLHQLEVLIYGMILYEFMVSQRFMNHDEYAGIFVVLFALSIYIFRYSFTPKKLYIIATFLFFILGTASAVLDIAFKCLALPLLTTTTSSDYSDQPSSGITGSGLLDLQSAPGNFSFVAR